MIFILIGQVKIFSSQNIEKEKYNLYYNDILKDEYWNLACLKDTDINLEQVWKNIKSDMENLNRQPMLYLMTNVDNSKVEQQLEKCNLENIYTDVWLVIDNLENFENYESKIEVEISQVKNSEKDEYIQAIMDGFSSDDPKDPYGTLPEEYRTIYQIEFQKQDEAYKTIEYCGRYNGQIIATANVWYKGDCANIYTVSTSKKYQKQGICKKLMSCIIKDLNQLGIKVVCVQTEQGFYTEQVYKNIGFQEVMLGKAYGEK